MAINDFGEKIGGAKKDLWKERNMVLADLSEMNAAEKLKLIKKDNVWKKPDYEALVSEGLPIKVAFFIKNVRDSLAAQPVLQSNRAPEYTSSQQEKYIEFVGVIRDAVMACKTEADVLELGQRQFLAENGFIDEGRSYYVRPTEKAGGLITNKFLKQFCVSSYDLSRYDREIAKKQFLYTDEQKILSKYEFYKYSNVDWETYQEKVVMKVSLGYGTIYVYPKGEFADKAAWEQDTFFVLDSSHRVVARNFSSKEEAQKFVLDRDKDKVAEAPKRKGKTRFIPVQLAHIRRDGDNYRHGRSMSGQDYLDKFGFRGGEFGNWMGPKDRQISLDYGYEALMDLAKALRIEPSDIALGKALAIAFGARGSGSAMAHYEPDREVINLTKMKGAGSLAHEWAHALDDILGKKVGLPGFMTDHTTSSVTPKSLKTLVEAMQWKEAPMDEVKARKQKDIDSYKESVRRYINRLFPLSKMSDEQIAHKDKLIDDYFNNVEKVDETYYSYVHSGVGNVEIDGLSELKKDVSGRVIPKEERVSLAQYQKSLKFKIDNADKPQRVHTTFYENSDSFDKMYSKTDHGYWKSTKEMFARAFACYVLDKIEGRSDYLCGHAECAASPFVDPKTGDAGIIKAFPEGEEREAINKCFDSLILELKEMNLLHHKEDFTAEASWPTRAPRSAEIPSSPERTHQLSFDDLLANAYERSNKQEVAEQVEFDLDL